MITKCPYCHFAKPDEPLNKDMIKILNNPNIPTEDFILWTERMTKDHNKKYGFKSYHGVKVHIGKKHKNEYTDPMFVYSEDEKVAWHV